MFQGKASIYIATQLENLENLSLASSNMYALKSSVLKTTFSPSMLLKDVKGIAKESLLIVLAAFKRILVETG